LLGLRTGQAEVFLSLNDDDEKEDIMSVVFIPGTAPSYNILSTDITAGSTVENVSYIGALVREIDTGKTYTVQPDLTLEEFYAPSRISSMPVNVTASGSVVSAGTFVDISLPGGVGTVGLQISGTWTGQIDFQGSIDGINFFPVQASNGIFTINATASNGIFILPGAGYSSIRAISTAGVTGAAIININASVGTTASIQTGALPQGTNLIGEVRDSWRVSLESDVTANDSDKTFTVPADTEWQVRSIWTELISDSNAGNRQITIEMQDSGSVVIGKFNAGAVQAQDLTRYYMFAPSLELMVAFVGTYISFPLPPMFLAEGFKVRVYDSAVIAPTTDDMSIQMAISSRTI
jgi:hypothetical protein